VLSTQCDEVREMVRADLDRVLRDLQHRWYGAVPAADHFDGEINLAKAAAQRATTAAFELLNVGDEASRAAAAQLLPMIDDRTAHDASPSKLRVVLMGRTQAGKSTLLAAMTRLPEHHKRIGKGAQRTSRDSAEGPWHAHPEVTVVDPPGIGAAGGDEDADVAFETVRDADLVVWVQSNDSSQQASLDAITHLCVLGKPMLLVLNFRADISRGAALDRFLRRPELTFRHERGHLARLGRHLDELGASWSAVLFAHLGSAVLADGEHPRSDDLRSVSGIESLEDALLSELQDGAPVRRLLNPVDRVRSATELAREALVGGGERAHAESDVLRRLTHDLLRRNRRSVAKLEEETAARIRVTIAERTGWHSTRPLDGIRSAWDDEQKALDEALDAELRQFVDQVAKQAEADQHSAATEWTAFAGDRSKLPRGSSAWLNKVAKIGTNLPALAPLIVSNPVTLTIAAVGVGVKLLFGKRVNRWIDRKTSSREALDMKRRESVGKQVAKHLTKIERQALDRLTQLADEERGRQDDERRTRLDRAGALEESARELGRSADTAAAALIELDTATARALLAMSGRSRIAATVVRAVRRPGIGMVAGATPAGHEESVLFPVRPLAEPHAIVAHPGQEPSTSSAFEAVFKLSGAVPERYVVSDDGGHIHAAGSVPDGLRVAWETMLSTYTNQSIHLH
jgi:hypothetical protein